MAVIVVERHAKLTVAPRQATLERGRTFISASEALLADPDTLHRHAVA
jgi:hypothetical protein